MYAWARSALILAAAVWVLVVAAGFVSIYGFDQFEAGLGRGATLRMYLWVATGVALVACVGACVGFRAGSRLRRAHPAAVTLIAAVAIAALAVALLALVTPPTRIALIYVAVAVFAATAGVTYLISVLPKRRTDRGP